MHDNLKLLVIDHLIKTNLLEYNEEFCDTIYDSIEDDDDLADNLYAQPIPELMDYFLQMNLTPFLDQVTTLVCEGGNTIYTLVAYQWDGEDDYFDLTSLEGIEVLENLETLYAHVMVKGSISLQPLKQLKKLRHLSLAYKSFTDYEALLEIEALESVDIHCIGNKNIALVVAALEEKGVTINCK